MLYEILSTNSQNKMNWRFVLLSSLYRERYNTADNGTNKTMSPVTEFCIGIRSDKDKLYIF